MSVDPVAQINQLLSEGNYQQALQLAQQYGLTQAVQEPVDERQANEHREHYYVEERVRENTI